MKVAVFGKAGQVATELQRRVPNGVALRVLGRDEADFSNPTQVYEAARSLDADVVINAVAYTAVDKAESDGSAAMTINGTSVGALAKGSSETGTPVVHISTDYVFSGDGTAPWSPNDPVDPKGLYGKSKLIGERELANFAAGFAVLRTSWVFSAHGNNFVKTMLKYGAERPELKVVADQIGGPTPAAAIADACFTVASALANGHKGGTFHFSGTPDASWADFAREIMAEAHLPAKITDIPTSEWPTPAPRPLNSRLDCSSLEAEFGISRPDWHQGLREVLQELAV